MDRDLAARLAARLDEADTSRQPIEPLSSTDGLDSVEDAYAVQALVTERKVARGDRVLGRKIGLTSRAMQQQMGVDEPDFGTLWSSTCFYASDGMATVDMERFLQPRMEGELAFLIGEPLLSDDVTPQLALAVTQAVAPAFEIIDSRIRDWRITLPDTIADNASYGGFVIGQWSTALRDSDLATLGMQVLRNGEPAAEGLGADALGGPARAVAWLLSKLGTLGVGVAPGDIVLSGSLGRAVDVARGDHFALRVFGQPPLFVQFA